MLARHARPGCNPESGGLIALASGAGPDKDHPGLPETANAADPRKNPATKSASWKTEPASPLLQCGRPARLGLACPRPNYFRLEAI